MIVSKVDVCMTMGSLQIQREQVELKNQKTARLDSDSARMKDRVNNYG